MGALIMESNSRPQTTESETPLFKAVGVVKGEVNFGKDGINTVTVNGKSYRLKYAQEKLKVFQALRGCLKSFEKSDFTLTA